MKIAVAFLLFTVAAYAAPRRVDIKVTGDGYQPSKVAATPGETVTLVFHGSGDMGCCDKIVVGANKVKVEKDKPSEVTVTVPASGQLAFACSMNMCKGSIGK